MLRLRLQRRGKKNYATYRVVIAERHAPVKGRFVADVGYYNPHSNVFEVDTGVVQEWLAKGVQPTATVHNLLVEKGILKAEKVTSWRPKKSEASESSETSEASKTNEATAEAPAEETAGEENKPEEKPDEAKAE